MTLVIRPPGHAMIAVLSSLAALLIGQPDEAGRPVPIITGIFPPGIATRSETSWTITGRDLAGVTAVIADDPHLRFGSPRVDAVGRSLTVVVAAGAGAREGYPAVRVEGPGGFSNLAIVRVDRLPQVVEVEPNDREPAPGRVLAIGEAVAGVIRALDVDRYRVEGEPGRRVTLDWETRRLGTAIAPVLTVTGPGRSAIGQFRGAPGGDRDCRTAVVVPPVGWFEVELRDNTYEGDDRARYRLRVAAEPFATAVYPLGGPAGAALDLSLGGGTVPASSSLRVVFPPPGGEPWLRLDPNRPAAPGPDGPPAGSIDLPSARLQVGDPGRAVCDVPRELPAGEPWDVPGAMTGVTINGRLDRPGAVARFRVEARAGARLRARVEAASAGSWLDSVVTILGPRGEVLGENDDRRSRSPLEPPLNLDGTATSDSEVDVFIREDGPILIYLEDRTGSGGPEYGYRLELGPPRDDFTVHLLQDAPAVDPATRTGSLTTSTDRNPAGPTTAAGAFNLAPGATAAVPLVVIPTGRPGIIDIEAVGLPAGVSAERLSVRTARAPRTDAGSERDWDAPVEVHALQLRVHPDAAPTQGAFRVVAANRPLDPAARIIRRQADSPVEVDAAGGAGRPVVRRIASFPIRVLDRARPRDPQ